MARLLILTPQLPVPPHALTGFSQGTTIRNFNLIAQLARRHSITLVAFAAPQPDNGKTEAETAQPTEMIATLQPYCEEIITAAPPVRPLYRRAMQTLLHPLPDMALRLASPEMRHRLHALLSERPAAFDVIQVEGIEMAPYIEPLPAPLHSRRRRGAGPRLIFDDHNAEYVLQQRACLTDLRRPSRWAAAAYSWVQWQKLARYERRICRAADHVVAVSEADRAALQRLTPGLAVTVVPNGVDLDFYRPGVVPPAPEVGPNALVFTGKMDYRPNVDAMLWFGEQVLPLIRSAEPDVHLYIVGQQPHPRLAALTRQPGVTITGRVPDTRPYIAAAAVYIVPLRIGGGTRLKVLEALAMGQAIVSTRLGCDGFTFEDGREVRFADEPAAFAAAVIGLLRDREAAARLGAAGRAYVTAHFSWQAIVPTLEALYP